MTLYADRVRESSTSTGTGTISLGGTSTGYRTFVAGIGSGNPVAYCIEHTSQDEWEVGIGTVTSGSPDTLTRTHVLSSSNSNALVNFSAGDKVVFCTQPAATIVGGYPDAPPSSPSPYDDECTDGSLPAKWTETANPTATGFTKTFAKYGTWRTLPNPGAASNQVWDVRQSLSGFAAGTAFMVTARLAIRGWNSGTNARATIALSNNSSYASGNYVIMGLSNNGGAARIEVYDGSFDVQTDMGYPGGRGVILHFQRNASNVARIWASIDGYGGRLINTETRNWDADYLFSRLVGHDATNNPSEPMIDWVRVNDERFRMPEP